MDVHTHDDLRAGKLLEGVFDAIGDIRRQAHLRLHTYLRGTRLLLQLLQQLDALLTGLRTVLVVVHHIERHKLIVEALVAHHQREVQQLGCYLRIFHTKENLLVIGSLVLLRRTALLLQDNLLRGMLRNEGAHDTSEENHHHDTIDHTVAHQKLSWRHLEVHTHHHHRDGACRMSRGKTEHHVTRRDGQTEQMTGDIGRQRLAEGADEGDAHHDAKDIETAKHRAYIN